MPALASIGILFTSRLQPTCVESPARTGVGRLPRRSGLWAPNPGCNLVDWPPEFYRYQHHNRVFRRALRSPLYIKFTDHNPVPPRALSYW